jgi:hypothetical protein
MLTNAEAIGVVNNLPRSYQRRSLPIAPAAPMGSALVLIPVAANARR